MKEKSDRERGASVVMEGVNDKTEGASTQQAGTIIITSSLPHPAFPPLLRQGLPPAPHS
jgi:hypothetical protein